MLIVTVLGLVGGARGRHRASPIHRWRARAAFLYNSMPPSKQSRLGNMLRTIVYGANVDTLGFSHEQQS